MVETGIFHLLEVALVNAYVMYSQSNPSTKHLTHQQFRRTLALEILEEAGISIAGQQTPPTNHHIDTIPKPLRLIERHFIGLLSPCDSRRKRQCTCVVCNKTKGRGKVTSTYYCKQCNLAMCVTPCFELYHTKIEPSRYISQV